MDGIHFSFVTIVVIEFLLPCSIALVLGCAYQFKQTVIKPLLFILAVSHMVLISFRPEDYNSDTLNYSNYIDALAETSGLEFLFLTKFEPAHLLFAALTRDFHLWLLLEDLAAICLLWILFRRLHRLETVAVILGSILPLWSSSIRFAVSLLTVSAVLAVNPRTSRFLLVSAAGGLTHVSMAVAGVFRYRKWYLNCGMLAAFFAAALMLTSVLERAGINDTIAFKPHGFRSFVVLVGLMLYMRALLPGYRNKTFLSDALSAIGIFVLSTLFFPFINRWLIMLMVIVAVDSDGPLHRARIPRRTESLAALVLYGALLIPSLVVMDRSGAEP